VERRFTACATLGDWPQARLHTQWPGKGRRGDPIFDAFYASLAPFLADEAETQALGQKAGAALLDRIGPALLLTHSQGGALGWLIADARPDLVRGIAAVEPSGPPMHKERVWGPTAIPLRYDPPVERPEDLARAIGRTSASEPRWTWSGPERILPNLIDIPVLMVLSESSYHVPYDPSTAAFLRAAGVKVEVLRLAEAGLRGNGHLMMLERNSSDVASRIARWLSAQR
jgi:pimeloyl-ACP methyl ester carboxylesterase